MRHFRIHGVTRSSFGALAIFELHCSTLISYAGVVRIVCQSVQSSDLILHWVLTVANKNQEGSSYCVRDFCTGDESLSGYILRCTSNDKRRASALFRTKYTLGKLLARK